MSAESMEWLNQNTKIGFTAKRGNAWHYRADLQTGAGNHYEGAVPVSDILRDLFDWEPEVMPVEIIAPSGRKYANPNMTALGHPKTGHLFGTFGPVYKVHSYKQWLIHEVANLLDADLHIASAGLLKGGAVAWVQIEMADTIEGASGFGYRPFLSAVACHDGSMSTTYQTGVTAVVCDNTLAASLRENTERVRVRHTQGALTKLSGVRDALNIVHSTQTSFDAELKELLRDKVSEKRFQLWAAAYAGATAEKETKGGRGWTVANNKREALIDLYHHDERVTPWKGTGLGVLQAANTYEHHIATSRGGEKAERNIMRAITGKWGKVDSNALSVLAATK